MTRVVLTARHDGTAAHASGCCFLRTISLAALQSRASWSTDRIQPGPEERDYVYAEAERERTVEVFCPLTSTDSHNRHDMGKLIRYFPPE